MIYLVERLNELLPLVTDQDRAGHPERDGEDVDQLAAGPADSPPSYLFPDHQSPGGRHPPGVRWSVNGLGSDTLLCHYGSRQVRKD